MVLTPALLCFLLICPTLESAEASPTTSLTGYFSLKAVTLDGRWTSQDEWTDTSEAALTPWGGSGTAYLRVKHDNSSLYVLLDFISDQALAVEDRPLKYGDSALIAFGMDQTVTYSFQTTWIEADRFRLTAWNGSKLLETDLKSLSSSSNDASQDPYSQEPHLIYEFRVPKDIVTNPTSFTANLFDGNDEVFMFWPARNNTSTEAQWGLLTLVDTPIPEFPSQVLSTVLFSSVALAVVILTIAQRRIRNRPHSNQE